MESKNYNSEIDEVNPGSSNKDIFSNKANFNGRRSTLNSLSPKLATDLNNCISKVEDFDFDIFELDSLVQTNSLFYVANEIFSIQNFFEDTLDENTFRNFIRSVTNGYDRSIAYHNDLHAADVLQTVFVLMEKGNVYFECELAEIDYISILISAICHDYKHPGIGNSYLINSRHTIAMNYNGNNLI